MSAPTQNPEGKFVVKKITKFSDLKEDDSLDLPESDLCFQNEDTIVQLRYVRPEEDKKYNIKPGIYTLQQTPSGLTTTKIEMKNEPLLETIDNTSKIIGEARKFFNRLHVYEKYGRTKKRAVLLYSKPGMGKTQAIKKFCQDFVKEDPGTVVFMWPTSAIEADSVVSFLSTQSTYTEECTRLILIIEDIGGGERDGDHGRSAVDNGLLDLLDGIGVTFKLPTFIIATTNHPENLLESLADRPGRFDLMMSLDPPKLEERIALLTFMAKRDLTDDEKKALDQKGIEDFSIAHLGEVVIRADLDDKDFPTVIKELIEHKTKFKNAFEEKRGLGLGFNGR